MISDTLEAAPFRELVIDPHCEIRQICERPCLEQGNADDAGSKETLEDSLDHVEDALVFVQPNVVVRDGDVLESDFLGVLEERVGTPHGF